MLRQTCFRHDAAGWVTGRTSAAIKQNMSSKQSLRTGKASSNRPQPATTHHPHRWNPAYDHRHCLRCRCPHFCMFWKAIFHPGPLPRGPAVLLLPCWDAVLEGA